MSTQGKVLGKERNPRRLSRWILRPGIADNTLGKPRTSRLCQKTLIKMLYKELYIIASYRIVVFNPEYSYS